MKPPRPPSAIERMELAMRTLTKWKSQGLAPRVRWEPFAQIVSAAGVPLPHPPGCLVECLWVLRWERPEESIADAVNRAMAEAQRRGPGGAA